VSILIEYIVALHMCTHSWFVGYGICSMSWLYICVHTHSTGTHSLNTDTPTQAHIECSAFYICAHTHGSCVVAYAVCRCSTHVHTLTHGSFAIHGSCHGSWVVAYAVCRCSTHSLMVRSLFHVQYIVALHMCTHTWFVRCGIGSTYQTTHTYHSTTSLYSKLHITSLFLPPHTHGSWVIAYAVCVALHMCTHSLNRDTFTKHRHIHTDIFTQTHVLHPKFRPQKIPRKRKQIEWISLGVSKKKILVAARERVITHNAHPESHTHATWRDPMRKKSVNAHTHT